MDDLGETDFLIFSLFEFEHSRNYQINFMSQFNVDLTLSVRDDVHIRRHYIRDDVIDTSAKSCTGCDK